MATLLQSLRTLTAVRKRLADQFGGVKRRTRRRNGTAVATFLALVSQLPPPANRQRSPGKRTSEPQATRSCPIFDRNIPHTTEAHMIWESRFWKDDLLRKAADLRKRKTQRRWAETSLEKLEQLMMLGFYGVRKLHEAAKLSSATMATQIPLIAYPWIGKNVTKLNWHNLDILYDFDAATTEDHDLLFLCHQFVHSFVFMASFDDDDRLDGILFASDRQRHVALLRVSIDQIVSVFEDVGQDYPSTSAYSLNPKTGDYNFVSV